MSKDSLEGYSGSLRNALEKAKASIPDLIRVTNGSNVFEGSLLPKSTFSNPETIILKAKSGYNYGINFAHSTKIEVVEKTEKKDHKPVRLPLHFNEKNPKISLLSTGGTISSSIDYVTGGISARYEAEDLLNSAPEIAEHVSIKTSSLLFNIMSEDVEVEHWKMMARECAKEINEGTEGVVVTHGTDTLQYSTAMLSFMLRDLSKPVVFTYSQKSSDRGASDAFLNLICSSISAGKANVSEVCVCGHATAGDDYCFLMRGNKVKKMHSSKREAFRPINDFPLAKVFPDGKIEEMNERMRRRSNSEVIVDDKLETMVGIVKFYPNSQGEVIDYFVDKGYKGIVVEGTGLGHINTNSKNNYLNSVRRAVEEGVAVVITSQAIYGSTNPTVYSALRNINSAGGIYVNDLLTETAYAKLMWVLGHERDLKKVRELMLSSLANEFNPRIDPRTFLY